MKHSLLLTLDEDHRLSAADPYTDEKIRTELRRGVTYTAAVTDKRSTSQNNVYWAGLAYAVQNIDEVERQWPTSRALHRSLLIRLGYYTEVPFIQIKRRQVTNEMLEVGVDALDRLGATEGMPREAVENIAREMFKAMQEAAPDYGMHIEADSTRFDAMTQADFTVYFQRAEIVMMEMTGRNPWDEYMQSKGWAK
jgi:hypothetical protein